MRSVFLSNGSIKQLDIPKPVASKAETLVKVTMAGICNTDLELVKGYMGFEGVPGHEFVGVVAEAQDSNLVGRRVCGEINFGCGDCDECLKGLQRHCPSRTVLGILNQNGAFADFVTIPETNLRFVPDSVTDRQAVFVEPVAAAMEILEQVHVEPNQQVAVVGDGKLGLLICQVLKLTGCELCLIGKHARKLEMAENWGVRALHKDLAGQQQFDLVVEASGSPSGFETALALLRPRGTLVLKSTYAGNLEFDAAPIVINEITLVGSRCGPFKPAIRTLSENRIDTEALIDGVFPFSEALPAFERAAQPGTLKIVLDLNV